MSILRNGHVTLLNLRVKGPTTWVQVAAGLVLVRVTQSQEASVYPQTGPAVISHLPLCGYISPVITSNTDPFLVLGVTEFFLGLSTGLQNTLSNHGATVKGN